MLQREKCFGSPSYNRQDIVWANKIVCKLLKLLQLSNFKNLFLFTYINTASSSSPRRRAHRVVDLKVPHVFISSDLMLQHSKQHCCLSILSDEWHHVPLHQGEGIFLADSYCHLDSGSWMQYDQALYSFAGSEYLAMYKMTAILNVASY